MSDTMTKSYYWTDLAHDVGNCVKVCFDRRQNRQSYRHQRHLQLFPASGPLKSEARNMLGPLPKTSNRNRFVVAMTDRYSKLTRARPTKTTPAPQVATIFMKDWIMPYEIPEQLLTDYGPQFVSTFFQSLCLYKGTKLLMTTAYHQKTIDTTSMNIRTTGTRL